MCHQQVDVLSVRRVRKLRKTSNVYKILDEEVAFGKKFNSSAPIEVTHATFLNGVVWSEHF